MENENKDNLFLRILCWIGLTLWAVLFFAGFNYWQSGVLAVGLPVAAFLLIMMGALVWAMKKHNRNDAGNVSRSKAAETAALAVYAVISLVSAFFICHFVTVTKECRTDIQSMAYQEINELDRIFDRSDEPGTGSYVQWVTDECDNYRISLTGSEGTKDVAVNDLQDGLMYSSGFEDLQAEVYDFLERCQYSVENWNLLTIPMYLNQLESGKPDYEARVVECSKKSEYTAGEPYQPNVEFSYENLDEPLVTLSGSDISFIAVLLVAVLQVMILMTYLSGRKSAKNGPGRYTGTGVRSYDPNRNNR